MHTDLYRILEVAKSDLSSQVVGQKDSSKSALDIWKEIFQTSRMKRGRKSSKAINKSNEFDSLLSLVSNRGDYDLILDGIHENMLSLRYYDPLMQKTVKCLDKLVVSDIVHKYIMRTQQMSLLVYQPPTMLAMHGLIAQINRPTIELPKSFHRCRIMLSENMDVLRSWHTSILPYVSRHLSTKSIVEESLSPFIHILSPPTLKQGYTSSHLVIASAMKQVLAHEVERQRILHRVTNSTDDSNQLTRVFSGTEAFSKKESSSSQALRSSIAVAPANKQKDAGSLLRQKLTSSGLDQSNTGKCVQDNAKVRMPDKGRKSSGGSYNFFHRFRKVSADGSDSVNHEIKKPETLERDLRPLLFKFNEMSYMLSLVAAMKKVSIEVYSCFGFVLLVL